MPLLCDEVKRVIYFFLDGTLGDSKRQAVDTHLSLCPDCEKRTAINRRLRGFVQKRLARLTASEQLKTRLVRSVRAFRTEWSR